MTASQLRTDVSLRDWNTFGVECRAERAADAASVDELDALAAQLGGQPVAVFGGGSNVILRSRLPACALRVSIGGIDVERRDGGARVTAGAGVRWHDLVRFCIGQRLFGVENLALIPGRVGAAPMQNIGAYGAELADTFDSLTAFSLTKREAVRFSRESCEFGYRDSVFKHRQDLVITSVTLALSDRWQENTGYPELADMLERAGGPRTAAQVAEAVIRVRRRKLPDPRHLGNAGSVFKNPTVTREHYDELRDADPSLPGFDTSDGVKVPAARLIERCGWKGRRVGTIGVWHRQPLVLVNFGGATGADVLAAAEQVRSDVASRFTVDLELEPRVLGTD